MKKKYRHLDVEKWGIGTGKYLTWFPILGEDITTKYFSFRPARCRIVSRREESMNSKTIQTIQAVYDKNEFEGYIISKVSLLVGSKEIEVNAMWDTGTTFPVISSRIVKRLGDITPIGSKSVTTANGAKTKDMYQMSLILGSIILDIEPTVSNSLPENVDVILGTEIISKGKFSFEKLEQDKGYKMEFLIEMED